MKFVRWVLGSLIMALDRLFSPKAASRAPADQAALNAKLLPFELYQFEACPFCVKVRRHFRASAISIPLRDATREPFRGELLREGGKIQAPCLKISKPGEPVRWLYESSDIIHYLDQELGLVAEG